jgi:hypothetical protein
MQRWSRVGQQRAAAALGETGAGEEVAVAADEARRDAGGDQFAQPGEDRLPAGRVVVVPDPHLEQIAEDVEVLGLACRPAQEGMEQLDRGRPRLGIEVQVGDEQRRLPG